jgi:hypothetical protein
MAEVTAAKFEPEAQDERRRERYEGELECRLDLNGASWRCWIRDLSLGGAGLEPAIPAALGQRVTLSSPLFDFDRPLCGRVINVAQRRTCLEFDLDPPLREQLERFIVANT